MFEIRETKQFTTWLSKLKDVRAQTKILVRLDRVREGNFGDYHAVGGGISEIRITEGQGYRVYCTIKNQSIIFLLCGGNKSSQDKDIKLAIQLKAEL